MQDLTALRILEVCGFEHHDVDVTHSPLPDLRSAREIDQQRRREARRSVKESLGIVPPSKRSLLSPPHAPALQAHRDSQLQLADISDATTRQLALFLDIATPKAIRARMFSPWPADVGPWSAPQTADEIGENQGLAESVADGLKSLLEDRDVIAWRDDAKQLKSWKKKSAATKLAELLSSEEVGTWLKTAPAGKATSKELDIVDVVISLKDRWRVHLRTRGQ